MSIDFSRAWQIARSINMSEHSDLCSFKQTEGSLLCDCYILTKHPEYLSNIFYGENGIVLSIEDCRRSPSISREEDQEYYLDVYDIINKLYYGKTGYFRPGKDDKLEDSSSIENNKRFEWFLNDDLVECCLKEIRRLNKKIENIQKIMED